MTTGQQTWPKQGARPAILPACQPQLERIAALERDRAMLLEYVRAEERVRATDPLQGTGPYVAAVQERDAARRAVIDAGLLEGDDHAE